MLIPVQLVLVLLQANPVATTTDNIEVRIPINIGPTHHHPTVAYVPYQEPKAREPHARLFATTPSKPAVYDLVVHTPKPQISSHPQRQAHVTAKFAASSSRAIDSAPLLRSRVDIPVPDDLTLIQPNANTVTPPPCKPAVAVKTSIPRIERILGVDSSNLPVTATRDDGQSTSDVPRSESVASDEIPVPTLGT